MKKIFRVSYAEARKALKNTQIRGKDAESAVKTFLNKENIHYLHGKTKNYLNHPEADVEVDFILDGMDNKETFISVTHSNPLIPGHSNENKLHQKISELYLFKLANLDTRIILVVGGEIKKWAPYVLKVFEIFFDEVVYVQDRDFFGRLHNALKCDLINRDYWLKERKLFTKVHFLNSAYNICKRNLREEFFSKIILGLSRKSPPQYPNQVKNLILRKMGEANVNSIFWSYVKQGKYAEIWQERNYFNPLEAIIELILEKNNIWFRGGLGKSVQVHHSVLHDLGFTSTRFTEDFQLFSKKLKKRIYIQCKSSSGGPNNTSKALPSRAREQIGRSILYRTTINKDKKLISNRKDYLSIYILDGLWNFPKKYPLKYVHLLQIAGADYILNGYDLVDNKLEIIKNNELEKILITLDCEINPVPLV